MKPLSQCFAEAADLIETKGWGQGGFYETAANTLRGTNTTWGQDGSSVPDQTVLKYETMGLITALLTVWAAAAIRIIIAIVRMLKKRSEL